MLLGSPPAQGGEGSTSGRRETLSGNAAPAQTSANPPGSSGAGWPFRVVPVRARWSGLYIPQSLAVAHLEKWARQLSSSEVTPKGSGKQKSQGLGVSFEEQGSPLMAATEVSSLPLEALGSDQHIRYLSTMFVNSRKAESPARC